MDESEKKNTEFGNGCIFTEYGETMTYSFMRPVEVSSIIIGEKKQHPYVPKEIHVNEEKKVIVVKWADDTETKVTCDVQDNFSVDVGFGMALTEHVFGSKREFKEKWWKIIQRRIKYH